MVQGSQGSLCRTLGFMTATGRPSGTLARLLVRTGIPPAGAIGAHGTVVDSGALASPGGHRTLGQLAGMIVSPCISSGVRP